MPAQHEPEVRLADIMATLKDAERGVADFHRRTSALEASVNDLLKHFGRPHGGGDFSQHALDERQSAIGLLEQKHFSVATKRDTSLPEVVFSEAQIAEAKLAIKGLRALMHSTSIDQVSIECRKALSAFSFGSQGFILAPEMSSQI